MEYTVKALAELAGVTPRTLRWYDRTGLLKPLRTTPPSGPFWTTRPLTARRRCRATWQSWRPVGPDWTI